MRATFVRQMRELNETLSAMSDLTAVAMEQATHAILQADLAAAEDVIAHEEALTTLAARADDQALAMLALQAPVAGDLRAIVAGFQIAADLHRMGGLAVHVAESARRRHPATPLPHDVHPVFIDMGRIAGAMASTVSTVLRAYDPVAAAQLPAADTEMNHLHQHLFTVLTDRQWTHGVPAAVDVILLGRFYERFADHAVLIGQRVIFQATGTLPRH